MPHSRYSIHVSPRSRSPRRHSSRKRSSRRKRRRARRSYSTTTYDYVDSYSLSTWPTHPGDIIYEQSSNGVRIRHYGGNVQVNAFYMNSPAPQQVYIQHQPADPILYYPVNNVAQCQHRAPIQQVNAAHQSVELTPAQMAVLSSLFTSEQIALISRRLVKENEEKERELWYANLSKTVADAAKQFATSETGSPLWWLTMAALVGGQRLLS